MSNSAQPVSGSGTSLVARLAERFGVDGDKFFNTLKATAFKQSDGTAPTNEQMMALLVVAEQYKLNPFTKEIYAFPDKKNGIIPVVGVDGWSRIINSHPEMDGIEFVYSDKLVKPEGGHVECPEWCEAVIYRKDRSRPTRIREYLDEVYRAPFEGNKNGRSYKVDGPWQTHTKRQLRHKSTIQGSRLAFGLVGIYDLDEAERIKESGVVIDNATGKVSGSGRVGSGSVTPIRPAAIDHKKVDPIVQKLKDRALESNAWSAAHQYVEDRFSGEERDYAVQLLRDAELECMDPPTTHYNSEHVVDDRNVESTHMAEERHENEPEAGEHLSSDGEHVQDSFI